MNPRSTIYSPCELCGANPGEPCRTPGGDEVRYFHGPPHPVMGDPPVLTINTEQVKEAAEHAANLFLSHFALSILPDQKEKPEEELVTVGRSDLATAVSVIVALEPFRDPESERWLARLRDALEETP